MGMKKNAINHPKDLSKSPAVAGFFVCMLGSKGSYKFAL